MRDLPVTELPAQAAHGAAIGTRGLVCEMGGRRILDGIDLALGPDGLTMIMGPNGAGKSVLVRLLHGLLSPSAGTVLFDGAPLTRAGRLRQAMVFQQAVLLRRSVAANIDFVLKARGRRDPARRDALLEHVGLQDLAQQPARLLSGGEQQRLALARALATDPEVLFLDEPTASLDPASVLLIEETVRGALARGTRVIFITHDVGQARRLADDVVFLHRGRLVAHQPAEAFFTAPAAQAARDYLDGKIVV